MDITLELLAGRVAFLKSGVTISSEGTFRLDAFAAMTDEERPPYEAWLAGSRAIRAAIADGFDAIVVRQRLGKLVSLGRPRRPAAGSIPGAIIV